MDKLAEMPVPYAARVAQYGRRLIFQNRNVLRLHEERLPSKGIVTERPWPMEFEGREYADERQARRAEAVRERTKFFDTWDDAEAWLYESP